MVSSTTSPVFDFSRYFLSQMSIEASWKPIVTPRVFSNCTADFMMDPAPCASP